MPIYEYKRKDGSTFEVIQKFTDEPLKKDPETGDSVERVYGAPAIHFKGSGFHNTDYGTKRRSKADSGEPAARESGDKPAASDSSSGDSSSPKATDKSTAPSSGPKKGAER